MARKRKIRTKRKKSKSNSGTKLAVFSALCTLAALLGAGIFLALNTEKSVRLDQVTLCPQIGARGTVAVLLDTTDTLSAVTKAEISASILSVQRSLPRYHRLSVFKLNEDGLEQRPVTSICNPGRLDQMNGLAQQGLTANPDFINNKYAEFEATIMVALEQVLEERFTAVRSPLLSSLQELSVLLPKPVSIDTNAYPAARNKVIFVTDLLEHTDVFSVYRSGLDFEKFKSSRATEKFGKSYKDVDIDMLVVRRDNGNYSTMSLVRFWAKVFSDEFGADIQSIKILSGEI